ncbi:hypothetical protein JWG39_03605 [Desulforhopalus vacuolatus]|uniref:hypothetical protein n=1 Tax=Desulforhopalus vacuolatus TaxID=40414 RepID=UPI0019623AAB|nr:hypothetical protein [Desulforhopalus vacuolatus]MBM9518900.1 hypothetical protein [Desulforhopalus vacuolatus]
MDHELRKLFDLRWKERAQFLQKEFLRVKQEMNARGLLNSSMTIQGGHDALVEEFKTQRKLISTTIIDFVGKTQKVSLVSKFQDLAQEELTKRRSVLESELNTAFNNQITSLQNSAMIAPLVSLDDVFPLATEELSVELNTAFVTYNKAFGNNLADQLRNRFLNNPILAVLVLSVAGATFILGLLNLLGIVDFAE